MNEESVDESVSRAFWAKKAAAPSNRWTPQEMFQWELDLLSPLMFPGSSILDLGSGHGELSRALAGEDKALTAIDWEPAFAAAFDKPNHSFICAKVPEAELDRRFDLVLLMGVVTCIDLESEIGAYSVVANHLKWDGVALVKNQCSRAAGFAVNGYSEALGENYSGRYPNADDQRERLMDHFAEVTEVPYPEHLNPWENSYHTAFICRRPL